MSKEVMRHLVMCIFLWLTLIIYGVPTLKKKKKCSHALGKIIMINANIITKKTTKSDFARK